MLLYLVKKGVDSVEDRNKQGPRARSPYPSKPRGGRKL